MGQSEESMGFDLLSRESQPSAPGTVRALRPEDDFDGTEAGSKP
jgi:hypothetical protein